VYETNEWMKRFSSHKSKGNCDDEYDDRGIREAQTAWFFIIML
jgi:hypothetical protein